ncbi:hypothetical protein DQ04_00521020 [Trypanosoma grayi]|uniref:hypothetical protein n=1 Tax=Trypanosoma grayi TaxID=71804 RepID=UPI0004F45EEB|nr:hypothetical protein DQ04_00521020 [Trypanosoma grayi]KEG14317.1 hypothetical protein DQ04_00521020 [Trypanosoma grayi]
MKQQKGLACVFHRHEVPDSSEYICACECVSDVCGALGLPAEEAANGAASSASPAARSAAALALHEAVSMTASHAEYTPHTRCHTVEGLTEAQATPFWHRSVLLVAKWIFATVCGSLRRGASVVGVYLTRSGEAEFTVGLITQGTARDERLQDALLRFRGTHTLAKMHAELPLCAAHRAVALRLWWEPRTERVTPHHIMPPVKVILDEGKKRRKQQHNGPQLNGYAAVNVFLCRPVASRLRGTTRKPLSCAGGNVAMRVTTTAKEKRCDKQPKVSAASVVAATTMAAAADPSRIIEHSNDPQERLQNAVVLYFDDLSVVEEGEHLVGVEVEAMPSYRAFVPALYGHLSPFLVVSRGDA